MIKQLFMFISSFDLALYYILIFLTVVTQNIYILCLFLFMLLSFIPNRLVDIFVKGELGKRPEIADPDISYICNKFGKVSNIFSSQIMLASFLCFYCLYEFIRIRKTTGKNMVGLLSFMVVTLILMIYIKVKAKCNTLFQIVSGILIGAYWASMFVALEKNLLLNFKLYKDEKKVIFRYLTENWALL